MSDALRSLIHALEHDILPNQEFKRCLFIRAQADPYFSALPFSFTYIQPLRPRALALESSPGTLYRTATQLAQHERFDLVLVLPDRQRQTLFGDLALAHQHLAPGGTLVISMPNDWGAKRIYTHLREISSPWQNLSKHHCRVFWQTQADPWPQATLESWTQANEMARNIDQTFWSVPNLFCWNKKDIGSTLLTEFLPKSIHGNVADFGCGWGQLSHHLLKHYDGIDQLDAIDSNASAMECVRRNMGLAVSPAKQQCLWLDLTTETLNKRYDFIVMNPPFHSERDSDPMLGIRMIAAAAKALRSSGHLWMVANRHLSYEKPIAELFEEQRLVIESQGFKVIHALKPNPILQHTHRIRKHKLTERRALKKNSSRQQALH
jgi:16S rRNA (guanine1207-N2)-methyltransferase